MVRAFQYKPLFDASRDWKAEFTQRRVEFSARLSHDPRKAVRLATLPMRLALNPYWDKRREDEIVRRASGFDVVSFIKSPGLKLYERIKALNGPKTILDLNDAVWLAYFKWPDLPETLAMVDGVICENEYVAAYARKFNNSVFVIPDSPQIEVFDRHRDSVCRSSDRVVIGWIGAPQNTGPLHQIAEPLEALFSRYPNLHLRIVGTDTPNLPKFKNVRYSCLPNFKQLDMVREVLGFDIGLFPLLHNDDGLARGTLKAMVYMSGGAVVVGEDFGENRNLIQDGVNGMLAETQDDWYRKLETLIVDRSTRQDIAARGLAMIRDKFTAAHIFRSMTGVFDEVLEKGR